MLSVHGDDGWTYHGDCGTKQVRTVPQGSVTSKSLERVTLSSRATEHDPTTGLLNPPCLLSITRMLSCGMKIGLIGIFNGTKIRCMKLGFCPDGVFEFMEHLDSVSFSAVPVTQKEAERGGRGAIRTMVERREKRVQT